MHSIEFVHVSKRYRVGRGSGVKDLLLGSRGHRHRTTWVHAVNDVSFAISPGESISLLGDNGSGKSTCLKLLAGTIRPSSGEVRSRGRIAPLLELGAGFHPDLTGRENIFLNASFLGLSKAYVRRHLDQIISFAGVEDAIDIPVRFYSSGMYVRLGFSVAIHADPEIVLIDEVLAVGDAHFQSRCFAAMARFRYEGRTVVLVTHSLQQAKSFTDRSIVLNQGALVLDEPTASLGTIPSELGTLEVSP